MLFSFHCPACKGKLEADASLTGTQADCPQCGKPVAIPEGRVAAGTTLAGFRLARRLGKGGMGEVYLAQQLSVDRQVAVKVLPPGFAADRQAVARFLHEGKLAARLDHHHIVTVHEAGEDSGNYYMAMAYVQGESLDQRLRRDKILPEAEALGIVRAVADALAYAWEEFQLLHRDIKPANIMLDRRERVFLMDLGLAKSLSDGGGLTLSGTVLGTPQYMSPEQAQGLPDLGPASDVYSLGATLYHLVTGTAPFTGDSLLQVLNQHIHEPLPPPRERNPRMSEGCSRLIEKMLAKGPSERYGDWRALLDDLSQTLPRDSSTTSAQSQRGEPAGTAAVPAPDPGSGFPSRRRLLSWPFVLAAAGILVLVLLAALALRGRGGAPVADTGPPPPSAPASPTVPTSQADDVSAVPVEGEGWTVPELGMEFVYVETGSFRMGSDHGKSNQRPARDVCLSRAFWVGRHEVTQGEYEALTGSNPSKFRAARNPVEMVSWQDAAAFCHSLTERERVAGRLPADYEYRLPTEAEWEYAARGGAKSKGFRYAGSDDPDKVAWSRENSSDQRVDGAKREPDMLRGNNCRPHRVGGKKANELGLCDLSGNVQEWCHDRFQDSYVGLPGLDPSGPPTGLEHVVRGGAWNATSGLGAVTYRTARDGRAVVKDYIGFRVALATPVVLPEPQPAAP
jgi:serine/threonine protein kinase/formylglycine-generating enzyme required for sulfatase activity